ncbi:aldo/keto reductase [Planotetraspora kaengkrachanensis]|uniref:Oxidoreductase n=1 Tax=Planotetraspora kaengkrachanensis TaxID=575193 RepID=A0A8J3PXY9_9ACTN|nr:aldo/keto reductase [Planotetraspora kaengkrachanensis]GIG83154.1 oxidoreductase [Planotetraspora kaengkrachanensis]
MRYTTFGRGTGLRVSTYGLGTGNFGTGWGTGAGRDDAKAIFEKFAEAGGTLIDTADGYQLGESERLLGEFLAADRESFVLASKYTSGTGTSGGVSLTGNSRKNMFRSVEASLRRLGTDYLDLYWVHFPDSVTPIEEILRGLDDLVRTGKILHFGLSNFPAWRVSHAAAIADLRGWAPVAGIQVEYSLVERTPERELLPMADALGLGVAQWSPLGGGLLTGKYRVSAEGRLSDWGRLVHSEDSTQKTAVIDAVLAIAEETGASPSQVSVAWLLERGRRSTTAYVPIIGPRSVKQLEDYLGALEVGLSEAQYSLLDRVSAVPAGVPHEVNEGMLDVMLGGDRGRFDRPAVPVA